MTTIKDLSQSLKDDKNHYIKQLIELIPYLEHIHDQIELEFQQIGKEGVLFDALTHLRNLKAIETAEFKLSEFILNSELN